MRKVLAISALMGVAVGAQAATATLTGVKSESDKGTSTWNIAKSTATWDLNTGTGVATQTGGTYSATVSVGKTPLMTHVMTGGVLSSGAAAASSWGCNEGIFGGIVGAHICGNFTFGGNGTSDSTVGNSGTAVTVVIGGDDSASGAPQSLATSYSNLALTNLGGGNWKLSNIVPATSGYEFTFNVVPDPTPSGDAVNDGPVTATQSVATVIPVGANDIDFVDPVSVTVTTQPLHGTITAISPGGAAAAQTITYTANAGYTGPDSFVYNVNDGNSSDTATVTISVVAPPPPPLSGQAATLTGVKSESDKGTSTWNIAKSTATWDLNTGTGVATQTGGTYSATVSVGKTPLMTHVMTGGVLSSGAAAASSWGCNEGIFGGIVGAHICGNFTFGGNGTSDSTVGNSGTAVTVAIGGDDSASGAPQSLATSYNNLALTNLGGGNWKLSNIVPATSGYEFTFNVVPSDAIDDGTPVPIVVVEQVATPIAVGANDIGFNTPAGVLVTTNPAKGTATVSSASGTPSSQTITYTAYAGQTGIDTFSYAMDDGLHIDDASVTVEIIALTANNDAAITTRGQPVVIAVGANDVMFDNTVMATIANGGACDQGGTAAVTAGQGGHPDNIQVTYTPAVTPAGTPAYTETCSYNMDDGVTPAKSANITIYVSNASPVANDGSASGITTTGLSPLGRTATFTAPGSGGSLGDVPAVITVTTPGAHGTVSVAGNLITYTINDATFFVGADNFTYTVTDLDGETDTGVVTVTIANDIPVISDGALSTNMGIGSAPFGPVITLGNGSAVQHALTVTSNGAHGSCAVSPGNATGAVTYTPAAGYTGPDSCTLSLADGDGDADTAIVQITVYGDVDGDGVDDNSDNCLGAANPGQQDTDGDGFGNWCDADFNNDGRVNFADLAEFRSKFGTTDPNANLDGIGPVNFADLARFKALFGKPPGPSALVP